MNNAETMGINNPRKRILTNFFKAMALYWFICIWTCMSVCAIGSFLPIEFDFSSDEFIESINRLNTTWKAGRNFPEDMPFEAFKRLTGARRSAKTSNLKTVKHANIKGEDIPETFDSRSNWPECYTIGKIRDQGGCGSCWAESVASVISDRICIQSGGEISVEISVEELISCSDAGSCEGGYSTEGFRHFIDYGLVTGGEYGTTNSCKPYSYSPFKKGVTPRCKPNCIYEYGEKYADDLYHGEEYYQVEGEELIQWEIMKNGPVSADFSVFDDFMHYKSGVYRHVYEESNDWHAVRIIGWGVENGDKYWLVANSWGKTWGDNGYFKIMRGNNECEIEQNVLAVTPELSDLSDV